MALLAAFAATSCEEPTQWSPDGAPTPSELSGWFSGTPPAALAGGGDSASGLDGYARNTLTWTRCPDDDFFSYVLCRTTVPGDSPPDPAKSGIMVTTDRDCTSFYDLSVEWAEDYTYFLHTLDGEGLGSVSNEVVIELPGGEAPTPSTLRDGARVLDGIGLGWSVCPDDDFRRYYLYRDTVPGIAGNPGEAEVILSSTDPSRDTCFDSGIEFDLQYHYCLRTTNTWDLSSWSNEVSVVVTEPDFPWTEVGRMAPPSPRCGAILPDGSKVYMTSSTESVVTVFDAGDYQMTAEIPVGTVPYGIDCSPDGSRVYAVSFTSGTLAVIDAETDRLLRESPLPELCTAVEVIPPGDRLCVLSPGKRALYIVDEATGSISDTLATTGVPDCVEASPDGSMLYVTDVNGMGLVFVEVEGLAVVRNVFLGAIPEGLALSDDGLLWTCLSNGRVLALECQTGNVVGSVSTGIHGSGIDVLPGGGYVYVTAENADAVMVLDAVEEEHVCSIEVRGASWTRCFPDGSRVLVGCRPRDTAIALGFRGP